MTMNKVKSSNIDSIAFAPGDNGKGVLMVKFKGRPTVYSYTGVPQENYDAMMAAESMGSYFAQFIRPVFTTYSMADPD